MVKLMSGTSERQFRGLMFAGPAVATVAFLFNLRDALALVVAHFHVTMATAFVIISLVLENSVWLMWVFPWIIPATATIEFLVALFSVSFAAAW
jgi:hypothetical protein